MMVGEHDWFLDMGRLAGLFGEPNISFDHKGVHFVVLMSVNEKDFWTARGMTPAERMHTVAGLDNGGSREVGPSSGMAAKIWEVTYRHTPIVFSHSPLYKYIAGISGPTTRRSAGHSAAVRRSPSSRPHPSEC